MGVTCGFEVRRCVKFSRAGNSKICWFVLVLWQSANKNLLVDIAVDDFGGKTALRERLLHRLREHYGAVPPARTAERNGQITFSLADVVGDQIGEQAFDAPQEFSGLRKRPDIPPHFRVLAREGPQTRHKMRIGQKSHVENQA